MGEQRLEKRVFWISLAIIGVMCAPLALGTERGSAILTGIQGFITGNFGWLYLWFAIAIFGVLVWLATGRYAKVKFGDPDSEPEFRTLSWIAMMFTAGIGSSIMYWGVIEWAYYYTSPPFGAEAGTVVAGRWATTYPLFHWGFTAWAIYCLPALPIAYAFHTRKIPMLNLSGACRGVIGDRADGWLGKIIDVLFMFGLVGGVVTTLGLGVPMISEGVSEIFGIERTLQLDAGIIVLWTAIFGTSVFVGLQRGLKRLADINVYLALVVGVFFLVFGPTVFIITTFTNSVGQLFQNFIEMSFYTASIRGSEFPEKWTIFYWAWWLAYAPFVGLFTARISRGRTIRGLILAMVLGGSLGSWLTFTILGNTGLYFDLNGIVPVTDILNDSGAPSAIIATVLGLPLGSLVLVVFLVLAMIYLATTLDSSAFILASVSTKDLHPDEQPARWNRVFWAIILGAVAVTMMYLGGLEPLQSMAVMTAFPMMIIFTLMIISFRRWLIEDEADKKHVAADAQKEVDDDLRSASTDDKGKQEEKTKA
ncbi:MAG: BCCT family transporter [Rubrobacteraceae bacterium]